MNKNLLENKNAVIYGAGGSLGGAVAKALAEAGARMFLTGHRSPSVQKIADEILASGGNAEVEVVDGFDERAIHEHLERVVRKAGTVDISFNAVDVEVKQNLPIIELSEEEYVLPITRTMKTRFLTAKAAGKVMVGQKSGVILFLTATPAGIGYPYTGGFAAACAAVENLSRNLASELGIYGVRVISMRSGGSPDSRVFREAVEGNPGGMLRNLQEMKDDTMLKKLPLMDDIANAAVFLASDKARAITGVTIDLTCGTTAALNYRVKASKTQTL